MMTEHLYKGNRLGANRTYNNIDTENDDDDDEDERRMRNIPWYKDGCAVSKVRKTFFLTTKNYNKNTILTHSY